MMLRAVHLVVIQIGVLQQFLYLKYDRLNVPSVTIVQNKLEWL